MVIGLPTSISTPRAASVIRHRKSQTVALAGGDSPSRQPLKSSRLRYGSNSPRYLRSPMGGVNIQPVTACQ